MVYGRVPTTGIQPRTAGKRAVDALEDALVESLARPPCLIAFSGGRDSSLLLAAACRAASRTGLKAPIPATLRFPLHSGTDERRWQEMVIAHLGIAEWHRVEFDQELGVVGPYAKDVLRNHGLYWPANLHLIIPLMDAAKGGSLVSGLEGDSLFGEWSWAHVWRLLGQPSSVRPRHITAALRFSSPGRLRVEVAKTRRPMKLSWLTPEAKREVDSRWARDREGEPRRWAARVRWWTGERYLATCRHNLRELAAERDVAMAFPFAHPGFLATISEERGFLFGSRTTAVTSLFSGLLPPALLQRESKAYFDGPVWSEETLEFARAWSGSGADRDLVDAEELRRVWLSRAHFQSATALQQAWLHQDPGPG